VPPTAFTKTQQEDGEGDPGRKKQRGVHGLPAVGVPERPGAVGHIVPRVARAQKRSQRVPGEYAFATAQHPEHQEQGAQHRAHREVEQVYLVAPEHPLPVQSVHRFGLPYPHHAQAWLVVGQPGHPYQYGILAILQQRFVDKEILWRNPASRQRFNQPRIAVHKAAVDPHRVGQTVIVE